MEKYTFIFIVKLQEFQNCVANNNFFWYNSHKWLTFNYIEKEDSDYEHDVIFCKAKSCQ